MALHPGLHALALLRCYIRYEGIFQHTLHTLQCPTKYSKYCISNCYSIISQPDLMLLIRVFIVVHPIICCCKWFRIRNLGSFLFISDHFCSRALRGLLGVWVGLTTWWWMMPGLSQAMVQHAPLVLLQTLVLDQAQAGAHLWLGVVLDMKTFGLGHFLVLFH